MRQRPYYEVWDRRDALRHSMHVRRWGVRDGSRVQAEVSLRPERQAIGAGLDGTACGRSMIVLLGCSRRVLAAVSARTVEVHLGTLVMFPYG